MPATKLIPAVAPDVSEEVLRTYDAELTHAHAKRNPDGLKDWESVGYQFVRVPASVAHLMEDEPTICGIDDSFELLRNRFLYHCMIRKRASLNTDGAFRESTRNNFGRSGRPPKHPDEPRDINMPKKSPREKRGENYGVGPAVPVKDIHEVEELTICAWTCYFYWTDEARTKTDDAGMRGRVRSMANRTREFVELMPGIHRVAGSMTPGDFAKNCPKDAYEPSAWAKEYNELKAQRAASVLMFFDVLPSDWKATRVEELKAVAWERYLLRKGQDSAQKFPVTLSMGLIPYAYVFASGPTAERKNIWRLFVDVFEQDEADREARGEKPAKKGPRLMLYMDDIEELYPIVKEYELECGKSAHTMASDYSSWYRLRRELEGLMSWKVTDG